MASLSGHQIDLSRPGMAGLLDKPAPKTVRFKIDNDEVVLETGSRAAVVYLGLAVTPDDVFREGYRVLQQGLDSLSISDHIVRTFDDLVHQHLLWWVEPSDGVVMRWSNCAETTITSTTSWSITRADRTTERSAAPGRDPWEEAHRYFRKAQSDQSAGDAFRNLYLAFEQAMSFAEPNFRGGEGAWTRRALAALIRRGVQVGVFATSDPDPVEAFMDTFYVARNGHSHAKSGRRHLVPHSLEYHYEVLTDLSQLGQLVLHTFAELGWGHSPERGMVLTGVRHINESLQLQLYVTDDSARVRASDTQISPSGRPTSRLKTRFTDRFDDAGFDFAWLGSGPASDLASPSVGRVVAAAETPTGPLPWEADNPPDLLVDGVDVFQYQFIHVHQAVFGRVRRHYPQ